MVGTPVASAAAAVKAAAVAQSEVAAGTRADGSREGSTNQTMTPGGQQSAQLRRYQQVPASTAAEEVASEATTQTEAAEVERLHLNVDGAVGTTNHNRHIADSAG